MKKIESVYIAGCGIELERVERIAALCAQAGIRCTSTWPAKVREVGESNPVNATDDQRREWSNRDLAELDEADAILALIPGQTFKADGLFFELGYGYSRGKPIIVAGAADVLPRSIFLALATEVAHTDEEGFAKLARWAIAGCWS